MIDNIRKQCHKINLWLFQKASMSKIVVYFVLILISYQFLYPLLRMLSFALMSQSDIINPSVQWIPKGLSFGNIQVAMGVLDLKKTLVNSIWFSGLLALAQTTVSALTGMAFARYDFKFKKLWFILMIVSFIVPAQVVMIPRLMMFTSIQETFGIQMIGTPYPQILMSVFGQGVYSAILILIFYNFTRLIPKALDEAASIDGANSFQIFFHVIVKLSISTLLVVFLFSFVWNWNESYLTATFLRNRIELLPTRLNMFDSLFQNYGASGGGTTGQAMINEAYKMSATLISITPLLVMYMLVQRKFIEGVENAGITGE